MRELQSVGQCRTFLPQSVEKLLDKSIDPAFAVVRLSGASDHDITPDRQEGTMGKTMCLAVEVADGMFPSEKAVTLRTVKGEVSCFVTADKVDLKAPGRGTVVVDVLDYNDDFGLVSLPSEQGAKIAKVDRKALSLVK